MRESVKRAVIYRTGKAGLMSPTCKMAYSAEADEDFKLPLRPWLEKQINSGRFAGLEWESSGGNSKEFRLPWEKKNSPDWPQCCKIFRAWAEHRGRSESEKLFDSKLKSNFRCALNKSVDFEEVVSKSQLLKQTGNYKVYRILSPKEVRERKKKRLKVQAKQESDDNSDEFRTIHTNSFQMLPSLASFSSNSNTTGISTTGPEQAILGPTTVNSNQQQSPSFFLQDSVISPADVEVCSLESVNSFFANSRSQSLANISILSKDISMDDEIIDKRPVLKENNFAKSLLLQQLENGGIKKEQLRQCQVIVKYNGEKVVDKDIIRMDEGCRIFSGKQADHNLVLELCEPECRKRLADLQLPGIQLPPLTKPSHTISAILDNIELGIVIRYEPQTLQFHVKRLCRSQVFFFDPHDHSANASPTKLERDVSVPLFSYERYFFGYMQQFLNTDNDTPPEAQIVLTVGAKPKSKADIQTMKGLVLEFIPQALKLCLCAKDPQEAPTFRSRESIPKS